jgi:hypothetical protein
MTADLTALTKRLEHGWALIDEAMDAKNHTEAQRLTDHWLSLLEQYQSAADVTLWEIAAQHEWRASMNKMTNSPIPFVSGQRSASQTALEMTR